MTGVTVVPTNGMPWENGMDVINGMVPAFRENLGPSERLEEAYTRYRQKRLWSDPVTTRRIDLIHLDPEYSDLTDAYHNSVEECFVLDGSCALTGEGVIHRHDYFWRPPGFVHSASTLEGFEALLSLEGLSTGDASGPTSRVIRPGNEAGTNRLRDQLDDAIGPRGWVRHLETNLVAWQPGPAFARAENGRLDDLDLPRMSVKVLSKNPNTGAQSLLVRLSPMYRQTARGAYTSTQQFFLIDGSVEFDGQVLETKTFVHRPGGTSTGPMSCPDGAVLFLKSDGWLDYQPGD